SDGDFATLVSYLLGKKKLRTVLSPNRAKCSYLLRRSAKGHIDFIADIRSNIELRQKETTPLLLASPPNSDTKRKIGYVNRLCKGQAPSGQVPSVVLRGQLSSEASCRGAGLRVLIPGLLAQQPSGSRLTRPTPLFEEKGDLLPLARGV